MPRLHTLYLPNGRRSTPFAFILDQTNPMTETAIEAWKSFAEKCGALDIMFTADTIDTDPDREISDGWQPDDDEPVDYAPADQCCGPRVIGIPDLVSMVQAAHAAAWVPWTPANLDPESPEVMTHRVEVCPAVGNGVSGCPMHAPIDNGPWVSWPYYVSHNPEIGATITRICGHGITHPTPEEYLGGMDIPHLCDGCPCAPEEDRDRYAIVVSDLANTRLPRGTLLLGVKDDPAPSATDLAAADWRRRKDATGARGWNALYQGAPGDQDDPTPVTAPPASPSEWVRGLVGEGVIDLAQAVEKLPNLAEENWFSAPITHDGRTVGTAELNPDGRVRGTFAPVVTHEADTVTAEMLAGAPLSGDWTRIQPLGADGEPVAAAKDYPLAGPVTITEKAYVDPAEPFAVQRGGIGAKWKAPESEAAVQQCAAGGAETQCLLSHGHEGLHDFGPFTRV